MGIEVLSLSELDSDKVQQSFDFIRELTQEEHPNLEVRQGVLADHLLLPSASHAVAKQEEIDRVRRSNSIAAINADPTLADEEITDKTVSNYLLTRKTGQAAVGNVTIVVSKLLSVTVPNGAVFEGNGKQFQTTTVYTARTSQENVQGENDRVLSPTGDGNYSFTITVTAVVQGVAGEISKDTTLVPQTQIANFVKSFAASDFLGGQDAETNTQLMSRVDLGLSAEVLSGRNNMTSLLSGSFPSLVSDSIIGFGDVEQQRDQRSLFPLSFGGRVDWYVRTRDLPQQVGLTISATLIAKGSDNRGTWQFGVGRDVAPGFYDVFSIRLPSSTEVAGTYDITKEVRSLDTTPVAGELLPDVVSLQEGAFSRYQATVVQFKDTDTDVTSMTLGDTQDYAVTLRAMPDIAAIQTQVGGRGSRNYAGDVLVRATIPCFVSVAFTIQAPAGAELPEPFAIQDDLATYVNSLGFCGRLPASALSDIIHNHLASKVHVSAIDMNGQIFRPDGSVRHLRDTEVLIIPDESENMLTSRTVCFILNPEDVVISAATVNIPEI